VRAWSDESGDFVFEGSFKSLDGQVAVFLSREGKVLRVPLHKLGDSQQGYLQAIDEERRAGMNPRVLAEIAPAKRRVSTSSDHPASAASGGNSSKQPTHVASQLAPGEAGETPARDWTPKNGKSFSGRVVKQEYSKADQSQCFVFLLPDGETRSMPVQQLPTDQKEAAVGDLREIRKAREARVKTATATAREPAQRPNGTAQQSPPTAVANSGLSGAFGALSQAVQATNQAQNERRAAEAAAPRANEPKDPKLSYDGQYPKCSFRLRLEECENKTDVDSLKLWRTLRLKLATSGLSLNEMDWAEHHFRNKLPTDGFTTVQKIQYTRFLELTAEGY
jgi:hypothetical protein